MLLLADITLSNKGSPAKIAGLTFQQNDGLVVNMENPVNFQEVSAVSVVEIAINKSSLYSDDRNPCPTNQMKLRNDEKALNRNGGACAIPAVIIHSVHPSYFAKNFPLINLVVRNDAIKISMVILA